MANIKLKKGFDLNLQGRVTSNAILKAPKSTLYAVVPDDFEGIIPRMEVKEGDHVEAGAPLFHDKTHEDIKVVSPVAGLVKEVRRGERRKIEAVVIDPNNEGQRLMHDTKQDVKTLLLESGLWAMMRQRPYDVVPNPDVRPRDIFVTCFDSAPLAPNLIAMVQDKADYLAAGVKALKQLTDGDVYLGFRPGEEMNVEGAIVNTFEGPHPAGNAGVQIANTKPVNKGEVVWTMDVVTLSRIGELAKTGFVSFDTVVAVSGEGIKEPRLVSAARRGRRREANHLRKCPDGCQSGWQRMVACTLSPCDGHPRSDKARRVHGMGIAQSQALQHLPTVHQLAHGTEKTCEHGCTSERRRTCNCATGRVRQHAAHGHLRRVPHQGHHCRRYRQDGKTGHL